VLLFDARTGERWPIWVELDSNATKGSQRLLEIRPATNLLEGHRYVVVLRNLRRDFTTAQNPNIARRHGHDHGPLYLDRPVCPPGSSFHYARKGDFLPSQIAGNVATAAFTCVLPRAATPATPARVSLYGHRLLGSHDEVSDSNVQLMAVEHDFVFCATDWAGLASEDIPNAISILQDFSGMKTLADRLQQGFVNQLYLGRPLVHPQGFAANPAFQQGGVPIVDPGHLYYDGNSQGGILGGALTALAPDYTRAVLGVPA
jgi:hypothetical protein